MSLVGGLFKSIINPMTLAQLAMGPAGWASLAIKMATQQLATMALQHIGQQLGLPSSMINAAQTAFGQASGFGNIAGSGFNGMSWNSIDASLKNAGFNVFERGSIIRDLQKQVQDEFKNNVKDSVQDFIDNINRDNSNKKLQNDVKSVMNGKGSILMKLAVALGQIADQKMNDMAKKAEQIGNMGKIEAKNQSKFSQMNAELSALGQEFGIVSQAMNNVLKSVGEGASTVARKN
ncbi:MAG: hypothetical protein ACRCY3_03980 [Sphingorhabdus sp.]